MRVLSEESGEWSQSVLRLRSRHDYYSVSDRHQRLYEPEDALRRPTDTPGRGQGCGRKVPQGIWSESDLADF